MSEDRINIMLCVNDENGNFTGIVESIEFEDWLRLVDGHMVCRRSAPDKLRLGRRVFPIHAYGTWVGNWCWDAVQVDRSVAQAMAEHLRATGKWQMEEAEESIWEAWENDAPIRFLAQTGGKD